MLVVSLAAFDLSAKPRLPIAGAPSPSLLAATSSPQAKITWAPDRRVRITLSPGENASSDVTFTSTRALTNVSLRLATGTDEDGDDGGDDDGDAGSIAPFLTFQPTSFATVPAGQPQAVHLSLDVPVGTALGKYKGWVRVKAGNQKLRKTLKVKLNVWQKVAVPNLQLSLDVPSGWTSQLYGDILTLSSPELIALLSHQDAELPPGDIALRTFPSDGQMLSGFASGFDTGWFETYLAKTLVQVGGHQAIRYSDLGSSSGPHSPIVALFVEDQARSRIVLLTLTPVTDPLAAAALFDQIAATLTLE